MRLRKLITMREALESLAYFGTLLTGDSWRAWRVLLIAIVGEELTEDERVVFKALTGREREPLEPVEEFWGVIGRRGGKTRAMAVLAAYLAACVDHRESLAPGERGVIPLLAASVQQAASAFAFVEGVFAVAPNLKDLVDGATSDTLSLTTGVDIQVRPASFRTIRGITAIAAIADEIAFWRSDDSAKSRQGNPEGAAAVIGDDRRPADCHLKPSRQAGRAVRDIQAPLRPCWRSAGPRGESS